MTSMWQEPLRFLYEHPPIEKVEFKNCPGCSVLHTTKKPNNVVLPQQPKDRRFRKSVPAEQKLQMISDFMNCNFQNYLDLFESHVSRQFVFKLPDPALGYFKGRLTPLMISKVFLPKTIKECQKSRLRIVKTIRLELQELIEDITIGNASIIDPDYKIIVLFRDPRAIENSFTVSPDPWVEDLSNQVYVCSKIVKNLKTLKQIMGVSSSSYSSRIKMIKYEDLVEHKEETVRDLYNFLNISYLLQYPHHAISKRFKDVNEEKLWNKTLPGEKVYKTSKKRPFSRYFEKGRSSEPQIPLEFEKFLKKIPTSRRKKFFKAKKLNTVTVGNTFRYYSTNRSKKFRHDHWKNEISKTLLDTIQNNSICQDAMESLNYKWFNLPTY